MSDDNIHKIGNLLEIDEIFGFYFSFSSPPNPKLDEISEKSFLVALEMLDQSEEKNVVVYIDPMISEGRHMFAKSPFRK